MSQEKLGLRERNKQEKRQRIQRAAWQLFTHKGFAATTMREVAELAQVGSGTLFLYAKDKLDLLQLVYYEALAETIEQAFRNLPAEGELLETLVYLFQQFFQFYQQHPENARAYIKAIFMPMQGKMYSPQTFQQVTDFQQRLTDLLAQFQQKGAIAPNVPLDQASSNFFALYVSNLPVPTTWAQYADDAVKLHAANPNAYITNFSPKDPGWFAGQVWQAGGQLFGINGQSWKVSITTPQAQQLASYWQDLISKKLIKTEPGFANAWYHDLQTGTLATWVSAV